MKALTQLLFTAGKARRQILFATRYSLLATFLLALSACSSSPSSRISKNQSAFDSFPPEIQQKIQSGQIAVGFTQEQVLMALGDPDHTGKSTTATSEFEVWTYTKSSPKLNLGLGLGFGTGGPSLGTGVGISPTGNKKILYQITFTDNKVTRIQNDQ